MPGNVAWNASKSLSESDYSAYLFDEERLSYRWYLFEQFSVPALVKNYESVDSFVHFIFYSEELPKSWQEKLFNLASRYPFIKVCPAAAVNGNIIQTLLYNCEQNDEWEGVFSIARLDDDDILSPHYATCLSRYLRSGFARFLVSFPRGYTGMFNQKNNYYYNLRESYLPKIAIGLSEIVPYFRTTDNEINFHRVDYGSHMLADREYPVILDASQPMYFWSRSMNQDTTLRYNDIKAIEKDLSRWPVATCDDVAELFTVPCSDEQF